MCQWKSFLDHITAKTSFHRLNRDDAVALFCGGLSVLLKSSRHVEACWSELGRDIWQLSCCHTFTCTPPPAWDTWCHTFTYTTTTKTVLHGPTFGDPHPPTPIYWPCSITTNSSAYNACASLDSLLSIVSDLCDTLPKPILIGLLVYELCYVYWVLACLCGLLPCVWTLLNLLDFGLPLWITAPCMNFATLIGFLDFVSPLWITALCLNLATFSGLRLLSQPPLYCLNLSRTSANVYLDYCLHACLPCPSLQLTELEKSFGLICQEHTEHVFPLLSLFFFILLILDILMENFISGNEGGQCPCALNWPVTPAEEFKVKSSLINANILCCCVA